MITTPSRYAPPWLAIAGFLVGMAGIAASITVAFLGMRSVLDVGGQCASGGPFVIAVPCPDGTWTLPLAIFVGLGAAFLAFAGGSKVGGIYAILPGLAWVGLFCALGFNFLQWGIAPPADPSGDTSGGPGLVFVLLGLMFEVMGIVPVITTLVAMRPGANRSGPTFGRGSLDRGLDTTFGSADSAGSAPGEAADVWSAVAKAVTQARESGQPMTILGGGPGGATAGGDSGSNLVAELERLTTLHQNGNLTDEEFAAAKQSLIKADA